MTTLTGRGRRRDTYLIQCPAGTWNGTLFLYSHGYVVPGTPTTRPRTPATRSPATWLLDHGYALAGSSYATEGWAIAAALPDQITTLNLFDCDLRPAEHHDRLGPLTRRHHHRRADPGLPEPVQRRPPHVRRAVRRRGHLEHRAGRSVRVPAADRPDGPGRRTSTSPPPPRPTWPPARPRWRRPRRPRRAVARLALVAALGDTPGWFTPLSPEPAATDYVAQEQNQFLWDTEVTFPFVLAFRAELEARAGGNVSWNTGVNYFTDLAKSADLKEVTALYQAAGLSLTKDLQTLNSAPQDQREALGRRLPGQVHLLRRRHLGPGAHHAHHRRRPGRAGERAGLHAPSSTGTVTATCCGRSSWTAPGTARSPRPRTITAVQVLLNRLSTGHWNVPDPARPERRGGGARRPAGRQRRPGRPAFTSYTPARYLRPFDLRRSSGGGQTRIVP